MPIVVAGVALEVPRRAPIPKTVPRPVLSQRAIDQDLRREVRLIESLRDTPKLQRAAETMMAWNVAEAGRSQRTAEARAEFRAAYRNLTPREQDALLAERAERFLDALGRVDRALGQGREDRSALDALHALGGNFESFAILTGLIGPDGRVRASQIVLRAAFKLRVLGAVAPRAIGRMPAIERIAFHGFLVAVALRVTTEARLRSIRELERLDPKYPADLAAGIVLARAGDLEGASDRLALAKVLGRRITNHAQWIAEELRPPSGTFKGLPPSGTSKGRPPYPVGYFQGSSGTSKGRGRGR